MSVKPFFYIGRSAKTSYEIGEKEETQDLDSSNDDDVAPARRLLLLPRSIRCKGDWLLIANSRPL